jgi:hypothetical protein
MAARAWVGGSNAPIRDAPIPASVKSRSAEPTLMVNPRGDSSFADLAEGHVTEGIRTPAELQARLRERYPATVVRERTVSSETELVWYVYREGRWVPA